MLTERRIRDAKPDSKTRFLWDAQVRNLGVRITPKGAKSYVVFYRSAGQKHLATLARVAELSLREARDRAGRQLAAIRAGEANPLERRRRAREAPTVADGLDRFFDEYAPARLAIGRMSPRTVQLYRSQAKLYIRPAPQSGEALHPAGFRRAPCCRRGAWGRGVGRWAVAERDPEPRAGVRLAPVQSVRNLGVETAAHEPRARHRTSPRGTPRPGARLGGAGGAGDRARPTRRAVPGERCGGLFSQYRVVYLPKALPA